MVSIVGTSGNDTLNGGAGNDTLNGGIGDDTMAGEAGNDTLNGGIGADTMAGGAGNDTYYVDNTGDIVTEAITANAEFQINTYTTNSQYQPSVTSLSDGGFVVTWSSYDQDGDGYGVFGQRYDSSGVKNGSEFQINTYTTGYQWDASVTSLSDSGFVVTWTGREQDIVADNYGIFGQRYDSSGVKNGSEFQINTYTTSTQSKSSVTNLSDGGFVVTWSSHEQDGDEHGVYGQLYDSSGVKNGLEFQINTYTTSSQLDSSVTSLTDGGFVVTWESWYQDGDEYGVYGQLYDSSGVKNGLEFQINTYTTSSQLDSSVTSLTDGGFVVTWSSHEQDGDDYGVYAKIFTKGGTADHVYSSVSYSLSSNVEKLYLTGSSSINATGNTLDNDIEGNSAANTLYGKSGADTLEGFAGNDSLDGGTGNDWLDGDEGNDTIDGGSGNDTLWGAAGNDILDGGAGDDLLEGFAGNDTIDGGIGDDFIIDDSGDNFIIGGEGDDNIFCVPGLGENTLSGGTGNDYVQGGSGNDTLDGDAGNDELEGSLGNDIIDGGSGTDTAIFQGLVSEYTAVESGYSIIVTDTNASRDGIDTLTSIEAFEFGWIYGQATSALLSDLLNPTDVDNGVYRFFNLGTGTHFYSASPVERNHIINTYDQFNYEGGSFKSAGAATSDTAGVHRFFNTQLGTHFFTQSEVEKDNVVATLPHYNYEGIEYQAYTSQVDGSIALYRFFNTVNGAHFFTPSEVERDSVIENLPVYNYEGIAYYVDAIV